MILAKVFSFVAKSFMSLFPGVFLKWLSSSVCLWMFHCGLPRSRGHTNSFVQKDGSPQIKIIWYPHTCSPEEQTTLLLLALFWTLSEYKRMTSQPDTNQRQTFFLSFNCKISFICDHAYWWDFVFKLSTRTFFCGCNSLYCSSLLRQWTASFDQMIKVHCCICKTYVYWICFIATPLLPHCAQSALRTLG